MEREIRFRVWDNIDKEMTSFEDIRILPHEKNLFQLFKEDRYFWMQYTGLKDKNGKEIYEGDIVDVLNKNNTHNSVLIITFEDGSFCLRNYKSTSFNTCVGFRQNLVNARMKGLKKPLIKVIGNIHENIELLK